MAMEKYENGKEIRVEGKERERNASQGTKVIKGQVWKGRELNGKKIQEKREKEEMGWEWKITIGKIVKQKAGA